MKIVSKSTQIGGKKITLEVGRLAEQADAAVLARVGDTMVLATVVAAKPQFDPGYFPLSVEYIERLYAGGRIKGSRWVKREGRPSDEAVLTGRLVDRSIRPLFPEGYKEEVQLVITVLSVDAENDADMPALWAASAALAISDIPWNGPIGAVRVGGVKQGDGESFLINPSYQDLEKSSLDVIVATKDEAVVMLEGEGKEVAEEFLVEAIEAGQEEAEKIAELIATLAKEAGKKKKSFVPLQIDKVLMGKIEKEIGEQLKDLVKTESRNEFGGGELKELKEAMTEKYGEEKKEEIGLLIEKLFKKTIRQMILAKERPDGRALDEVRPIDIELGLLPRTHGSAMFKRGQTQVLTVATLGSSALEQLIENMEGEESKRYIHHYNFPPYSVGETGRMTGPGRREIGHGALAERAVLPVVPSEDIFPYTIHLVSEVMSSNGSTSMAAACGSTLALMDAGVPITALVAGVAMGKVSEGAEYVVLTDIVGLEDFNGDMDFKLAGTEKGATAIQLDVKTLNLTLPIIKETIKQAREGRLFILEKMKSVIASPRPEISKYAPKITMVKIPVEKIGEVIGPGGKIIKKIIAETGASVDVDDDGSVSISSPDEESMKKAVAWVENLVKEVKVGEIYEGTVVRIEPFGAFVEILPGKDGLVHVSRMGTEFVNDPNEKVQMGQKLSVRVSDVDAVTGKIALSMILDPAQEPPPRPRGDRPAFGHNRLGGDRGRFGSDRRGGQHDFRPRDRGGFTPQRSY
ncbi:MAG: polyribonucleotide nucleotidyltransferase [Candidatus Shapirobacteria bacterium]